MFESSKTKRDALRRLGELLGFKFDLARGSTIPTALFTAATQRAHVSDDGQMPDRAERVVRLAGLEWDRKCDSRHTPSGGGATVTLTGLNRLLEALERLGVTAPNAPSAELQEEFGSPYRPATGGVGAEPVELVRNWDALDDSTRIHSDLQNALATYVSSLGIDPKSPKPYEPMFDLAWVYGETTVVVEVKSANDDNHRQQVRLGIGQVLEYVSVLNDASVGDYRPVLVLSEAPDPVDYLLAANTGVVVIGSDQFNELGLEDLVPLAPLGQ